MQGRDPGLLVVFIDAPYFKRAIGVAHAPRERRPREERNQCWENIAAKALERNPGFIFSDSNARVGRGTTPWIGNQGWAEEENDNGG